MSINNIHNKVNMQNNEIMKEVNNIADMTGQISNTMHGISSARSNGGSAGLGGGSNQGTPHKRDFNMNNIKVLKPSPQHEDNSYGNFGGGGSMMNQNKVCFSLTKFI